jgi:uncharacterized membrane protein
LSLLPAAAYELAVAPAAFALALRHARRALGTRHALAELVALFVYGYALEWAGMRLFRAHDYGAAWHVAPGGVPLAVAAVWAAVIVATTATVARHRVPPGWPRALAAALVATTLDALIEPVAVHAGLWRWTPPGAWLGVPLGNFVGWAVIVTGWVRGLDARWPDAPLARTCVRRGLVGAASIAALAVVGTAWQAMEIEARIGRRAGWTVAALLGAGTLALLLRRRERATAETVAGRLGRAEGRAPETVLLLLFAAFAWSALARLI